MRPAIRDRSLGRRRSGCVRRALASVLPVLLLAGGARAQFTTNILHTAHNLSVSGTGDVRAMSETRVCIFCHTPHNATPLSPLWNRELQPQVYMVYTSPTLGALPMPQPAGPTKLCLSCHDGTIAMGAVVNPAGGITMAGAGTLPGDSLSNFGLDLSAHHPVSFSYQASLPNPELAPSPPADLVFGGADQIHCTTCHDPHNDRYGKFLLKDNRYSALCTTCHEITGWAGSAHAVSTASVVGILPRPPKDWPDYTTLAEWGCETCHTPHFAPTASQLLNFTSLPPEPFSCTSAGCHSSDPAPPHSIAGIGTSASGLSSPVPRTAAADIAKQIRKPSAHHELPGMMAMRAGQRTSRSVIRGVTCIDCHNPHLGAGAEAEAPLAGGALIGVSGTDRNGIDVAEVRYEYEVCLKCHGDHSQDVDFVRRVVPDTNKRQAFDPSNASFHPVMAMGRALDVPSIPSSIEPSMTSSSRMSCSTCHSDNDGVSDGPHGSDWAPILRERYETADNTMESFENYALCYRCHDRSSILSDRSFSTTMMRTTPSGGGHSGHLAAGTPCSACHDPHGISEGGLVDRGATGSHTHLINFDTTIVSPKAGGVVPLFTDKGTFTGSCDLVCHGIAHDNSSYP